MCPCPVNEVEGREDHKEMNWDRVKVQVKPDQSVMTLEELKARLGVIVNEDDLLLQRSLRAAEARIDGPSGIGYAMLEQTWRLSLDCFPAVDTIYLPGAPVQSVTTISYVDTAGASQTIDAADYLLDTGVDVARLEPAYGGSWPSTRDQNGAVTIDYVLGESNAEDVPDDLVDAVALLAGHRYENREATSVVALNAIPYGVDYLIEEYRRLRVTA